jgi:phenylalanyl-tRNA synthetase alpha chain
MVDFDDISAQFQKELAGVASAQQLEELRVRYLGRKAGVITDLQKGTNIGALPPEERRAFGQRFNTLKQTVEQALAQAQERLSVQATPKSEIDLTLPRPTRALGNMHPITLVQMELEEIFTALGFMILDGFEVETEYYNFDSLNIPADHPAREMQDTYWLTNGRLLRTHTSANQVRALERFGAPLRAIFPGRCFRYESIDASHENTFAQMEGLMVDRDISVANLIAVMKTLLAQVFHRDVSVRLRPGFFPFVEPGFELDIRCLICGGKGCPTCKQVGWLELLPCGLVHPRVLQHGHVDSTRFSGFAFGVGLTRLAMMKYGIPDIRLMNCGDLRMGRQFPAVL